MFSFERKAIDMVNKYMHQIALTAVFVLGVIVRYSLREYVSQDASKCLIPWYDFIKENGGLTAIGGPIGTNCNYNLLYRFIVALLTYIPLNSLYLYKIFSCVFDFALAFWGYRFAKEHGKIVQFAVFSFIWLSPLVFLNSSCWAQCDSIYTFFAVLGILMLIEEKYLRAFIFAGISFAFKLQFVFVLPFFIFVYLYKKRFSILYFLIIPVMLFLSGIPAFLMGKEISSFFMIYVNQTRGKDGISLMYPSFWNILDPNCSSGQSMNFAAICITVAILGVMMVRLLPKEGLTQKQLLLVALVMVYTCVLFLPSMHERYGYMYEILAILVAVFYRKTIPAAISLSLIDLTCYGAVLFNYYESPIPMIVLSIANFVVYLIYIKVLAESINGYMSESVDSE